MAKRRKRLLMIAYYFPPLGGAGVQRTAKFAKYLARLGWQIEVVTVVPPFFEPVDVSLQADVEHDNITINRAQYRPRFRQFDRLPGGWRLRAFLDDWLQFPDRMQGWLGPALAAGDKICRQNPGIVIFSTSAPYTAHLIGRELKRCYGYPWIADFRDEWSQNPYLRVPSLFHLHRHQKAELSVLNGADAVISVSDSIIEGLNKLIPAAKPKFRMIPNGFDPDDFKGLEWFPTEQWTLAHIGTLNRAREELLGPVIHTLDHLISGGIIPMPEVKLRLIGAANWHNPEYTNFHWIETQDYLPHYKALEALNRSNLALLAESNPAAFTGKIFEYLALQKPILGLVHPESPAARLIKEAGAGWIAGPDPEALAEILIQSYSNWRDGNDGFKPREEVTARYNRELQALELAEIMEQLLNGN